jgi:bis(5'-nucleosidyl)-tetraphosphatase
MKIEESCGILALSRSGKEWQTLLLLHRAGEFWGFPKGHRNADEGREEAAIRELEEETGLKVTRILDHQPLIERYRFKRGSQFIEKTVYFFPALVEGVLRLEQKEILDGKWVTFNESLTLLTFEESREICRELIDRISKL